MTSPFYKEHHKHYVSVDCLILGFKNNKLYLLLAKRRFEPYKGANSLMAGFIRPDENLTNTVARVVQEYTGIEDMYMEQVGVYGEVGRDTADRVISIAYYALINIQYFDEKLCKIHDAEWVEVSDVGSLVFDHNKILTDTLDKLKKKASSEPIGFSLLPEKFTLPQLQSLYEAIYQTELDKRNFRKKILSMDLLEKQKDKDMENSRRGAFYYKFNKEKYDELLKKGFYFSL